MTLDETLRADTASSMKAGTAERTGVLRLLRNSLQNEAIKLQHELSEDEAMKVIVREAKQRRDSIEQYTAAGRSDLSEVEEAELAIINEYLPQPLTSDELSAIIDEVIASTGATDMKQMGAVVGGVMSRVGARADGGTVAAAVRTRLGA